MSSSIVLSIDTPPTSTKVVVKSENSTLKNTLKNTLSLFRVFLFSTIVGLLFNLIFWGLSFVKILDFSLEKDNVYYIENTGLYSLIYEFGYIIFFSVFPYTFMLQQLTSTSRRSLIIIFTTYLLSICAFYFYPYDNILLRTGWDNVCQDIPEMEIIMSNALIIVSFIILPIIYTIILCIFNKPEKKNYLCILGIFFINELSFCVIQLYPSLYGMFLNSFKNNDSQSIHLIRFVYIPILTIICSTTIKKIITYMNIIEKEKDVILIIQLFVNINIINRVISNSQSTPFDVIIYALLTSLLEIIYRFVLPKIKNHFAKNKKSIQDPELILRNARFIVIGMIVEYAIDIFIYVLYYSRKEDLSIQNTFGKQFYSDLVLIENHVYGIFPNDIILLSTFLGILFQFLTDLFLVRYEYYYNIPLIKAINDLFRNKIFIQTIIPTLFINLMFGFTYYNNRIINMYMDSGNNSEFKCALYQTCNKNICCNETLYFDNKNYTNKFILNENSNLFCKLLK